MEFNKLYLTLPVILDYCEDIADYRHPKLPLLLQNLLNLTLSI